MQLKITGRQIAITDALRRYIEKKMTRLARYGVNLERIQVVLAVEKYRHLAEVTAKLDGAIAQATASSREMYATIDAVLEKIARQIEKRKTRRKTRKAARRKALPSTASLRTTEPPPGVIHVRARLESMLLEEALTRLGTAESGLVVFFNPAVDRMQVLRRLDKERVELIDPRVEPRARLT